MEIDYTSSNKKDSRGNRFLIARKGSDLIAHIVMFGFGNAGGHQGIGLWVYDRDHNVVHSKIQPFQDLVSEGNMLITLDDDEKRRQVFSIMDHPEDQGDMDEEPQIEFEARGILKTYTENNVKIEIVPMNQGAGHWVRVLVDDQFLTALCKDKNKDKKFYELPSAIKRAKSLLKELQGWTTKSW